MIDTEYIKDKKKTAKKLQRKSTTTMEKEKLDDLRGDVPTLDAIIIYTENITALRVFTVEILRQSSTGQFGPKKHFLSGIKTMKIEKHRPNSRSSFYSHLPDHRCKS